MLKNKVSFVEHHLCHMSSAYYASNFNDAAVVSIDGFGDFASGAYGFGKEMNLIRENRIIFPHSLGIFYTAITQYLGFPNYGDEYKVMGLAPYGKETMRNKIKKLVSWNDNGQYKLNLKYFSHTHKDFKIQWNNGVPVISKCFSDNLIELLGPARLSNEKIEQRHFDIAKSTQIVYEESFFNFLHHVYKKFPSNNLCLAGGCAANSVANGKIVNKTNFKSVYIQSAAGDAGGALGAAYCVYKKLFNKRPKSMYSPYLGTSFTNEEVFSKLVEIPEDILNEQRIRIYKIGDNKIKNLEDFRNNHRCSSIRTSDWMVSGKMEWVQGH